MTTTHKKEIVGENSRDSLEMINSNETCSFSLGNSHSNSEKLVCTSELSCSRISTEQGGTRDSTPCKKSNNSYSSSNDDKGLNTFHLDEISNEIPNENDEEKVDDSFRPNKRRKKEKNTPRFLEMKKNNSIKEFRLNPSRLQFTEKHSHALLTFSPNLFHTVACKYDVLKDYLTALSEQEYDLDEIEKDIEFKFRLDKDMKISDAFIGIVFFNQSEINLKSDTENKENKQESNQSNQQNQQNSNQQNHLNSQLQYQDSQNNLKEDEQTSFTTNSLARVFGQGESIFSLSNHVGETPYSYGVWCFDSSIWNNKIRRQKSYVNNTKLLEGGVHERIPRGSLLQMSINKISVEEDKYHLGILWRVDQGDWFGFDTINHPEAQVSKSLRKFRIGISFGMSGIQISSMK